MSIDPVPPGYHTVTPYLVVPDAAASFAFLEAAFRAVEVRRTPTPDGGVLNVEVRRTPTPDGGVLNVEARVGNSMVMVVQGRPGHEARPASLYLYVPDVDAAYARAVAAGGVSLLAPADMFYGDRSAGVADPAGNHWWLNARREILSTDELAARTAGRA